MKSYNFKAAASIDVYRYAASSIRRKLNELGLTNKAGLTFPKLNESLIPIEVDIEGDDVLIDEFAKFAKFAERQGFDTVEHAENDYRLVYK